MPVNTCSCGLPMEETERGARLCSHCDVGSIHVASGCGHCRATGLGRSSRP